MREFDQRDPSVEENVTPHDSASRRENPYLRKNREKAARDRRQARTTPQASAEQPDVATEREAIPATPSESADKPLRSRLSDFMFEHVKPITAIVTVCVILSLVLITDIVGAVRDAAERQEQNEREEITLRYVEGLSKRAGEIGWSDLATYRRNTMKADESLTWVLPVKGTHYEVWIAGVSVDKKPTYVYLFDMKTGDHINLNEDDVNAFVKTHP